MPKIPDRKTKPTAVGIHVFAGGFSLGVRQAGFDVLCHLEAGRYGVDCARLNWPELPIHVGENSWPLDGLAGRGVDLIYCNPPCAPWSTAGICTTRGKDGWKSDPRVECWLQCFRALKIVRPKVFAVESVTQVFGKGREFIDARTEEALSLGYSVTYLLIDAKWCGLPQCRKRFFFVAHSPDAKFWPSFDFSDPPTVGEVLSRVEDPGPYAPSQPARARLVHEMRPGEKMRDTFHRLHPAAEPDESGIYRGRPGFLVSRLNPDRQMGAFVGSGSYHPSEDRRLGANEMKAMCGYPQGFQLCGPISGYGSLLARAVLPPVGRWLARETLRSLRAREQGRPPVVKIDLRQPGLPVEEVRPPSVRATVAGGRRPRVIMLAAPMAWGKDTVLDRLREVYGYDQEGSYESALPGRTCKKPGKNFGQPISSKKRPRWKLRGSNLLIFGRGDDPGNGLPDALVVAYREATERGWSVLAQCRLFGSAMSHSSMRLLREGVQLEDLVWMYCEDVSSRRDELIARMSGRGGRSIADVERICDASVRRWAACRKMIGEHLEGGATGVELPVGTEEEQLEAVRSALVELGELPEVPEVDAGRPPSVQPARKKTRSRSGGVAVKTAVKGERRRSVRPGGKVIRATSAATVPPPDAGERSGEYMRRLASSGTWSPEDVLPSVMHHYEGRPGGNVTLSRVKRNFAKVRTGGTR